MTTEILRSMLYRGADEMREVAWVVFDEVHYLRDKERGVVWEESIVLLPSSIKLVFLSATIPNATEFAQWVAELKRAPCHVIATDYRPTPLQHFMFPSGGQGLYLVLDEGGEFLEDNFSRMIAAMNEGKQGAGRAGMGGRLRRGPPDIHKVVSCILDQKLEPAIVFAFSRKECEALAIQLQKSGKFEMTTADEQQAISDVYAQALECLSSEDQQLPQIQMMLPLLLQGFGVHHSGLLPILRELIEILFQEGLLRVLFATETFALGLNMPARTCVFTNCRKFDGREHRWITCSEYIQMAGRAGRRGIDDKGFVITMFDEQLDPHIAKGIVSGQSDPLCSTFHLTYNMILNATRNSGGEASLTPEAVISRSFHHFQSAQSALRQRIQDVKR
jgi:ATP-dependent RNA helicase DOB1